MKSRTLMVYWLIVPLIILAYIVAMSTAAAKDRKHDPRGPHAYHAPNGNAWGWHHGSGKPNKTP